MFIRKYGQLYFNKTGKEIERGREGRKERERERESERERR